MRLMRIGRTRAPAVAIARDDALTRAPDVVGATRNGETVLLDPKRGQYVSLNEVGTRVWELLGTGTTLAAIVGTLTQEYELSTSTPCDQIDHDVRAMLSQLQRCGLLRVGHEVD
jgi:hypothetical protein